MSPRGHSGSKVKDGKQHRVYRQLARGSPVVQGA